MKKFIPVLAYHSLDPARFPGNKLAISPELFQKQMLFLKERGFRTVPLEACVKSGWKEGFFGRKVAMTFDDGYQDNYERVFPVLKGHGFAGTFFVTPGDVGKEGFMTWDMLKEMARTPSLEIGSHTLYHKPLGDIPEKEAWESIVASKKILEDRLGKEVRGISYPSGSFNDKILEMVRGAGYVYGCAASHIHDRKYEGNPYLLRRIKISVSSGSDFAFSLRLSGFYHFFGRP
ncbi:MAG TPA: polysaccharide deacetylase family protein [Candidatus Omnitrophota bacterium]|nr:polysaccharide deacetylase family protein [Candidatus Omnitrophota bacterium]HPS37755.1 polysaccharide deacetylase family protein [Candidatus Omnitrophota bacterium]